MGKPTKERRPRKTYTVRDIFVLYPDEKAVYHEIFKETVLKNRRCAQLSLSDLSKMTGIAESTVDYQLKKLQEKRMIDIDTKQRPQKICINVVYKEIVARRLP